jgi:RHS repeat-associated protein
MICTPGRMMRNVLTDFPGARPLATILCLLMLLPQPLSFAVAGDPPRKDAPSGAAASPAGAASEEWASLAGEQLEEAEYEITWQSQTVLKEARAAWQAPNRAQRFRTFFLESGVRIVPRTEAEPSWQVGLDLLGYGRGRDARPASRASLSAASKRIEYQRDGLVEWFVNGPDGLEHGFTLPGRPEESSMRPGRGAELVPGARRAGNAGDTGGNPAFLSLRVSSELVPRLSPDGQAIEFAPPSGGPIVLRYSSLLVRDANGRALRAWMERFHEGGVSGIRLVFDDTDAAYPVTVDPVATTASWKTEGEQVSAHFGWSVASAGDVNNDGFDDVIVGAPDYDNGQSEEGRAYVFLGSPSGLATTPVWTAEGDQAGAQFGYSVASAGDVNNDGFDDVVVGAPFYTYNLSAQGRAFVYHGTESGLTAAAAWMTSPAQAGTRFGWSVTSAGNVNGDAYADVVVGAPYYDNGETDEGALFVYHGGAAGLAASPTWTAEGNQLNAHFGWSVASAGNVNNDAYGDVIVGAPDYDNGQTDEGRAFCFRGSPTGLNNNGSRPVGNPSSADWSFESDQASAHLGWSVAAAGKVNPDSYGDVIVGAPDYDNGQTDEGRAWVFLGSSSGLSVASHWTGESDQASARFGYSVASAGNVNGDVYDEILVGAPYHDNPAADEGRVSLFYGSSAGLGSDLARSWAWRGEGNQFGARFGLAVASAGDVNGDHYADVLVGAPYYHRGQAEEGAARVFHGATRITNVTLAQQLGLPGVASENWGVVSGTTTLDPLIQSPDVVSFGPIPGSVLLTTGRAQDGGLGDTDWLGDGLVDKTTFDFRVNVPADRRTLCLTTQFITAETTFTNDWAWLEFERQGATTDPSGTYELSDLATQSKNPSIAHCIDVQGWSSILLRFGVEDRTNGAKDSGLLISRVYFSTLPMPSDVETDLHGYMNNPAPQDVSAASGTYSYAKQLFSVPGVSMPFDFSLSYSSASTNEGPVGPKWFHSYEAEARKLADGPDANTNPDNILVRPGGGTSEYFKENDAGTGIYAPRFQGSYSKLTLNNDTDKTVTYVTKDNRTYEFKRKVDANTFRLTRLTDAGGNSFTFGYDATHRSASITDTRGQTFTLTYHGTENRLSGVRLDWSDDGGSHTSTVALAYDDSTGLLQSITDLSGLTTRFTYTPDGRLLVATDHDGVTLVSNTYEHYNGLGVSQDGDRLATQRNGNDPDPFDPEAGVAFSYRSESVVRTDRLAREDMTAYDVRGRTAWQLDRSGVRQDFTYDRNNNPTEVRRTLPGETSAKIASSSSYDGRGNPLTRTEFPALCIGGDGQATACVSDGSCPDSSCGSRTDMSYDIRNNLRSRTDHYGNATTFDYDAQDNLIREQDPAGNAVSHVYSTVGTGGAIRPLPTSTVDARGNVSVCTYDERGYLTTATGPLGGTTVHSYDDLGHRTSTTDPDGNKTCFTYDDGGRQLAQIEDCGRCVGGSSDGASCTDDAGCPGGGRCGLTTAMTYDAQGRLLTRTEPDGAVFRKSYTATGKLHEEIDPLGHAVRNEYDAEDRLVARLDPHPGDRPGLPPETRTTAHTYDTGDRLTEVRVYDAGHATCPGAVENCLVAAQATYDSIGNLTGITDPLGAVTTWQHDLVNRVASETDGLGTVRYAYDARGLLTSMTSAAGNQIGYSYDSAGRLMGVSAPGASISHVLDANGNRTTSRLGAATVTRSFDALDHMTARTDEFGNTVRYVYDPAGNITELVYPTDLDGDGQADRLSYTYDRLNRMKTATDWGGRTTSYSYDSAGKLSSVTLPDASTVAYTYDAARRLTGVNDSLGGQTLFAATHALNAAGLRTSAQQTLPLEPTFVNSTRTMTYGTANTLVSSGAVTFTYDADGNMLTGTLQGTPITLAYNALNQLVGKTGGAVASFRYDADGLRVESVKDGVARRFVYDVTPKYARLLEEQDSNGNVLARYSYGLGLVSRLGPEGMRVFHFDSGGNTVALASLAGAVTDRYAYDPYGQPAGGTGTSGNPFLYAGRDGVYDDGNGLLYMRARYYAPELMRFVQKDQVFTGSVEDPLSLNRYAYARGNPLLLSDPNGEFWHILFGALIGAVINAVVACINGCDAAEIAGALLEGAVAGAVMAAFPASAAWYAVVGVGALAGAGAGFLGASVELGIRAIQGKDLDPSQLWKRTVTGGLGGAAGAGVGLGAGKAGRGLGAKWATFKGVAEGAARTGMKDLAEEGAKTGSDIGFGFAFGAVNGAFGGSCGNAPPQDSPPDLTGTTTDSWNPISAPQPGPQRTTAPGNCASEVWR